MFHCVLCIFLGCLGAVLEYHICACSHYCVCSYLKLYLQDRRKSVLFSWFLCIELRLQDHSFQFWSVAVILSFFGQAFVYLAIALVAVAQEVGHIAY